MNLLILQASPHVLESSRISDGYEKLAKIQVKWAALFKYIIGIANPL